MPTYPVSQIGFALAIMQAVKGSMEADANLKVDGNFGIQSITLANNVPDGTLLILDWSAVSKCPGIHIWCRHTGRERVLMQTFAIFYELRIHLLVENNRRRTGDHENQYAILESAGLFTQSQIQAFPNSFVDGTQLQITGTGETTEFERAQRMRRRDVAYTTIPMRALYKELV